MVGRSDCLGKKVGTTFDALNWLSLDACGLVCVSLSAGLHIFALVLTTIDLWYEGAAFKAIYGALYLPSTVLALISLFMAWSSDPGAVPLGARPLPNSTEESNNNSSNNNNNQGRGIRRCRKCNDNFKPSRAHHDSVTGRCIVKMDHYCPWIGNAVGALNHKFFVLFVFYTFLSAISCLSMILVIFMDCDYFEDRNKSYKPTTAPTLFPPQQQQQQQQYYDSNSNNQMMDTNNRYTLLNRSDDAEVSSVVRSAMLQVQQLMVAGPDKSMQRVCNQTHGGLHLALIIICFIFMIFTSCMLVENYDTIQSNTGKIARMKIKAGFGGNELNPISDNYNEMFGGKTRHLSWHWFIPTPVKYPEGMRDQILGYIWKEEWGYGPYRCTTATTPSPTTYNTNTTITNNTNLNQTLDVELGKQPPPTTTTTTTSTANNNDNTNRPAHSSPLHLPSDHVVTSTTTTPTLVDELAAEENIPLIQDVNNSTISSSLTKRNNNSNTS